MMFWMLLHLSNLDIQTCVYLAVDSRRRVDMVINKHRGRVEILQHTEQTSSVPIVCHTAAIINLPCSVFKHLDRWRTKRGGRQTTTVKHKHIFRLREKLLFLTKGNVFLWAYTSTINSDRKHFTIALKCEQWSHVMELRGLSVQDQSDDENQKKDKTGEKINCGLNRELNTVYICIPSYTLYGVSWYSSRNILSWLMQMFRSPSVNS